MAKKEDLLRAIRKAMQGEQDSVILYETAAEHSPEQEVKDFFLNRGREERRHYSYLSHYYKEIEHDRTPTTLDEIDIAAANLHPIFSDEFIRRIGEDQYLFSAISTALLLEKDAFEHYRKCAEMAHNLTLQAFFGLMEGWEMKHYDELLRIQKDAELIHWEKNDFEPF